MNIETVKEFFMKNNVEDDDHIWYSKNFYAVLELLKYDKAYEEVVMQGLWTKKSKYIAISNKARKRDG